MKPFVKCSPAEFLIEGSQGIASVSGDQTIGAPAAHACKVWYICVPVHTVDTRRGYEVPSTTTVCLIVLRQGLSVNWNPVISAELVGQQSPETCLSLSSLPGLGCQVTMCDTHWGITPTLTFNQLSPSCFCLCPLTMCMCSLTKLIRKGVHFHWKLPFWI